MHPLTPIDEMTTLSTPCDANQSTADDTEIASVADARFDLALTTVRTHRNLYMEQVRQRCCERERDEELGERMVDWDCDGME